MARKPISKKTRFDIFKRDAFQCQYCGMTPPNVVLHIDHIIPVAKGGKNLEENMITACSVCNLGKSANLLTSKPQKPEFKTEEIREREEQIRAYYELLGDIEARLDQEAFRVLELLKPEYGQSAPKSYHRAAKSFCKQLGFFRTSDAMEIASEKFYGDKAFKYFCGICWNKIREKQNG